MIKLLVVLGLSLLLAYCSEKELFKFKLFNVITIDVPLIVLIVMLSLFCGLRTNYNDTWLYNRTFKAAPTLAEYWNTQPEIMDNPLFYGFRSFFKHSIVDNCHAFNIFVSAFSNICFIRFIKKYSSSFTFSILLLFATNLYMDTMGAAKQCFALAILTFAIDALIKKRIVVFYIITFIAMLAHPYAIFVVILPLFVNKPWTIFTYLTIFGFAFILLTFESSIEVFLSVAEDAGKSVASEEIYDNTGINPFRLAVYAVPAILSFIFNDNIEPSYDREKSIFMNMSILSFLVMSLGLFMAANMFGRSAIYFELGIIILMPWIIKKVFSQRTATIVFLLAGICYIGFFMYDNSSFGEVYRAKTFMEFIETLKQ